ncbi:MAG: DNA replication/repair protein RecF [Gammaproteobacteria bacterium]|nr:DNA replication/repair protein RecF [Gammaproteobacteria bacterium]MDE2252183.1 DNA replication/repair protein RecF [Gammaproteobacteria bacterium]
MSLLALEVEGLRCLSKTRLDLHPHVNRVTGANGAGKTSILEAIYLLGRGRSFRTRLTERLIAHDAGSLQVFGRTDDPNFPTLGFGFDRQERLRARIAGRDARSLAELSVAFPVQVVDPGIHRLVEEGPAYRRRWLDWGVFHVEPGFAAAWTDYARTLRQRNAALKIGDDPSPWEPELVRLGSALAEARSRTMALLEPHWRQTLVALLGEPVTLSFFRGWSQERELAEILASSRERDRERGSTSAGAHRFDVQLRIDGRSAREVLSRGQQKLLGAALALSMARLAGSEDRRPPTLLLDDPAAELDREHTGALLAEIRKMKGQLVVTALQPTESQFGSPDKAFHVEHGRVTTL